MFISCDDIMKSYFKIISIADGEEIHFAIDNSIGLHIAIPDNVEKLRIKAGTFRVYRNIYVNQDPQVKGSSVAWDYTGYSFYYGSAKKLEGALT